MAAVADKPRQAAELNSFEEALYAPKLYDLKVGVTIYPGTIVAVATTVAALVQPAADAANIQVLGVWKGPTLVEANGDKLDAKLLTRNIALMVNDDGTPITDFDINKQLYVVNDQTLSTAVGGNSVKAGKFRGFGNETLTGNAGVYCDFSNID